MLCPQCGGGMRIISFITDRTVIDKILRHIGFTHPGTRRLAIIPRRSPAGRLLGNSEKTT
jgi:hypothetical protein